MLEILPSVLVQKKLKLDTVERIMGPFPAPKFKFVYETDHFPVRGGTLFYRIIDKKKNELFVDKKGAYLVSDKPSEFTFYGKYKNAKGSISREHYLKPYQITITKKERERGEITRYFAKYTFDEDKTIFEIKKQDFGRQTNFYKKVSLLWTLKGKGEKVRLENEQALETAEDTLTGIKYFLDPLQYYEGGEELTKHEKIQEKLSNLKY